MEPDPFSVILGLPPGERPPDHYALLQLSRGCDDVGLIRAVIMQQRQKLGRHVGPTAEERQAVRLVSTQLDQAEAILTGPQKTAYDQQLSGGVSAPPSPAPTPVTPSADFLPPIPVAPVPPPPSPVVTDAPERTPRADVIETQDFLSDEPVGERRNRPVAVPMVIGGTIALILIVSFVLMFSGSDDKDQFPEPSKAGPDATRQPKSIEAKKPQPKLPVPVAPVVVVAPEPTAPEAPARTLSIPQAQWPTSGPFIAGADPMSVRSGQVIRLTGRGLETTTDVYFTIKANDAFSSVARKSDSGRRSVVTRYGSFRFREGGLDVTVPTTLRREAQGLITVVTPDGVTFMRPGPNQRDRERFTTAKIATSRANARGDVLEIGAKVRVGFGSGQLTFVRAGAELSSINSALTFFETGSKMPPKIMRFVNPVWQQVKVINPVDVGEPIEIVLSKVPPPSAKAGRPAIASVRDGKTVIGGQFQIRGEHLDGARSVALLSPKGSVVLPSRGIESGRIDVEVTTYAKQSSRKTGYHVMVETANGLALTLPKGAELITSPTATYQQEVDGAGVVVGQGGVVGLLRASVVIIQRGGRVKDIRGATLCLIRSGGQLTGSSSGVVWTEPDAELPEGSTHTPVAAIDILFLQKPPVMLDPLKRLAVHGRNPARPVASVDPKGSATGSSDPPAPAQGPDGKGPKGIRQLGKAIKQALPGPVRAVIPGAPSRQTLRPLVDRLPAGTVFRDGLGQVISINLGGKKVSDVDLAELGKITSLQRLDLNRTAVSDAGLKHLSGLTSLTFLNLGGTKVTDAGLVHLHGMTKLRFLNLLRTEATGIGAAELRKLIPRARISAPGKPATP